MIDISRRIPKIYLDLNLHPNRDIFRIDYIENKKTSALYQAAGILADEYYMFHETHSNNVDKILQNNFDVNFIPKHKRKESTYGNGIYFSEFPNLSMTYGTLILCRVLSGRVQIFNSTASKNIPDDFDSRKYQAIGAPEYSSIHVIKNPNQILLYCVINLKYVLNLPYLATITTTTATAASSTTATS